MTDEAAPTDRPDLYEGLLTTRAIRRYRSDEIPDADLNALLFAATRAPSGHNRQPFRFLVVRRTPEMAEVRAVLTRGYQAAWASSREEPAPDDTSRKARMARTMSHFVDHIGEAPVLVLACLDQRVRHADLSAGASVFPACQNLLLAARALGYGGVMTNWHQVVEDELAELLGLPADVTIAATIPLGRPVGGHGPVRRLPLPELVFEGRWGEPAPWAVDPPGTRYTGG
jgi:nitroreductase